MSFMPNSLMLSAKRRVDDTDIFRRGFKFVRTAALPHCLGTRSGPEATMKLYWLVMPLLVFTACAHDEQREPGALLRPGGDTVVGASCGAADCGKQP